MSKKKKVVRRIWEATLLITDCPPEDDTPLLKKEIQSICDRFDSGYAGVSISSVGLRLADTKKRAA